MSVPKVCTQKRTYYDFYCDLPVLAGEKAVPDACGPGCRMWQKAPGSEAEAVNMIVIVTGTSIIAHPSNPALYTNRAMSRMKLGLWNLVIDDCQQALHQDPTNMKAFYQLSQAQLELKDYEASVNSARKAQELALTHNDKSLPNIMNQVRKAIRARWEGKERSRVRENVHLEEEAVAMYSEQKETALQTCTSIVEREEVAAEWNRKIHLMRNVFERARSKDQQKRDPPPDWLLCDISFQVMIDPVMVSGVTIGYCLCLSFFCRFAFPFMRTRLADQGGEETP